MKPVQGFDRPVVQWLFVLLGVLLVAVAAGEAVGLRRAHGALAELRRESLEARVARQRLELRLAQEQSARESFALEAARQRGGAAPVAEPTLTLTPVTRRQPTPPEPTVGAPPATQSVQLRLMLAGKRSDPSRRYLVSLRSWSGGELRWSRGDLRATAVDGRAAVTARMAGDVLAPGAYEILLSDVTAADAPVEAGAYEVAVRAAVRP